MAPRAVRAAGTAGVVAPVGEWTFVAYVKSSPPGCTGPVYQIYVNNSQTGFQTLLESTVVDKASNLPTSTGWTINGRTTIDGATCCQFAGSLDEVRLTNVALAPSEFLVSKP